MREYICEYHSDEEGEIRCISETALMDVYAANIENDLDWDLRNCLNANQGLSNRTDFL